MEHRVFTKIFLLIFVLLSFTEVVSAQDFERRLELADSLLAADQYEASFKELKKLDSLRPTIKDSFTILKLEEKWADYHLTMRNNSEAVTYFEKLKHIQVTDDSVKALFIARAWNDLGIAYYRVGELDSAEKMHHRSVALYQKYDDHQGMAYNYNNLAILAKTQDETQQAKSYFKKSLESAMVIGDSMGVGYNYLNLALLYGSDENRVEALDYFYRSIKIFKELGNHHMVAMSQVRLGTFYNRMDSYDSAYALLSRAETYYKTNNKERHLTNVMLEKASLYLKFNQLDSSEHYAGKALLLAKQVNFPFNIGEAYLAKAYVHKARRQYARAEEEYIKGFEQLKDYKSSVTSAQSDFADLYLKMKQYPKAIQIAKEVLRKKGEDANPGEVDQTYYILYKAHKALGKSEEALQWMERYNEAKDSINSKETSLALARIEYRDYLEDREQEESLKLERVQLLYEQEHDRWQWILSTATVGAVFFIIIISLIYRLYTIQKKDHQLLTSKNTIIETKNEELNEKNEQLNAQNDVLTKLMERDRENQEREKQLLVESMASKEKELAATAMINHEKNSVLNNISEEIKAITRVANPYAKSELTKLQKMIDAQINSKDTWDSFVHQFEALHPNFFDELKSKFPNLTVNDLKLCAYIKVGMNNKEIAQATFLAHASVKKSINRLKKKLGLEADEKIRDFMLSDWQNSTNF